MADTFDVIVLGGGPAGENVAGRCAAGGLSVALAERELVGGECSYWGCIPSKTLVRPGDVLAALRRVPGAREVATGRLDTAAAFARRDVMTGDWRDDGQAAWLAESGIELIRGHGRIAGERRVEVTTAEGDRRVDARRGVVVATGTTPAMPPIDGLAQADPWNNRDATAVTEVPERLLVLGGGAIGAEMAQCLHRLGSGSVTVVEAAERLLFREEPFAGEEVRAAFIAEGIDVVTGAKATAVERATNGDVRVTLADGRVHVADEILVAVGRRPATGDLGLPAVGIEPGRYLTVDEHYRVIGVPGGWLYAVGDCNGLALLTHMGKYQGRVAADHLLGRPVAPGADGVVPRVTFTDPQVAAVGLTVAEAGQRSIAVREVTYPLGDVAGAYTSGEGVGGTGQLVIDETDRVVVGATFTGPGVGELLHAATIAVVGRVPVDRLWHAVPAFPTVSEIWLRLLETYGL